MKINKIMKEIFLLFAIVYTFIVWGFWWGILSFILSVFPLIDLVKWLIK